MPGIVPGRVHGNYGVFHFCNSIPLSKCEDKVRNMSSKTMLENVQDLITLLAYFEKQGIALNNLGAEKS